MADKSGSRASQLLALFALVCACAGNPLASADAAHALDAPTGLDATRLPDADTRCAVLHAGLTEVLAAHADAGSYAGGAVASVISPPCGRWVGAVGEAEPGVELTADRLLRIGSVTKTFTAATVLTLAADSLVALDDTLESYQPGYPNGEQIRVRQLLNHTAGTFNITDDSAFMAEARANPTRVYTPAELVAVAAAHEPAFEPGTSWGYSNTNYLLLGLVIEQATSQPAATVIRERTLQALGLDRVFLEGAEPLPEPIAPGYGPSGADVTGVLPATIRWTGGGMVAEVGDLATWIAALAGGDLLAPAEQAAMLAWVPTPGDRECGLGIFSFDVEGVGSTLGHTGSTPGFAAVVLYAPALRAAAAVIVNNIRGDAKEIAEALLGLRLTARSGRDQGGMSPGPASSSRILSATFSAPAPRTVSMMLTASP